MFELDFSPASLQDLIDIQEYIVQNYGEETSKATSRKILNQIRNIKEYPFIGADLGEIIDWPTDYRYSFVDKNYIFYRVDLNKVLIVRILNEKQDFVRHLFNKSY